jgi:hypothetical protein
MVTPFLPFLQIKIIKEEPDYQSIKGHNTLITLAYSVKNNQINNII